jgi:hypothetical protein
MFLHKLLNVLIQITKKKFRRSEKAICEILLVLKLMSTDRDAASELTASMASAAVLARSSWHLTLHVLHTCIEGWANEYNFIHDMVQSKKLEQEGHMALFVQSV